MGDILKEVGIACEVVVTTHAGHARFSLFISPFICCFSLFLPDTWWGEIMKILVAIKKNWKFSAFFQIVFLFFAVSFPFYVFLQRMINCDPGNLWAVVRLATMEESSPSQVSRNVFLFEPIAPIGALPVARSEWEMKDSEWQDVESWVHEDVVGKDKIYQNKT